MAHLKSAIFLMLLLSCSLYSYWLSNKDYEWIVPYMNDRAPAAVRDSIDFQKILEKPMRVYKRETVASSISVVQKDGKKYLSMGQFPISGSHGNNLICLEYPYLKLKFVGEGSSVNGKKTVAWLSAPCKINEKNRDFMSDVPLPFGDLQRWPAQDQDVDFSQAGVPVQIKFDQVYGVWPAIWQLESIEFYKDGAGDKVILDNYEFLQKLGEPVLVK
jgi:hypothetical protein